MMKAMRSLTWVFLAALTALGCKPGTPTTKRAEEEPAVPRAVVAEPVQNAGDADYSRPREFTFAVENTGTAPLKLTLVKKSCDCAAVDLPPGDIPPSGKGEVKVTWTPIPGNEGLYTLTTDLETNDPEKPTLRLQVKARINPLVHIVIPPDLEVGYIDFGDQPLNRGEVKEREVKVFSTDLPAFTLEPSCSHPGFEVVTTPLSAGAQVVGFEVRSGYTVVLRTTDRLPSGYVREDLFLTIKAPNQPDRRVTLPVYAVVGNGVFKVKPEKVVFNKPKITDEDSFKVRVEFFVAPDNEKVEVVKVEPEFLDVARPVRIRPGIWEVIVRIPKKDKTAEAAKHQADPFVEGKFVLKVTAKEAIEHPVRVKWDPTEK